MLRCSVVSSNQCFVACIAAFVNQVGDSFDQEWRVGHTAVSVL